MSITNKSDSGDRADSPNGKATAIAADSAAPLGTEVRDGKFGFVITGVEPNVPSVGDNPYLEQTAQGKYVLVHVDVTNTSDKPQSYFGDNQKLIDTQGRQFSNDTAAELVMNPNIRFEINPGNRMSTTLAFDVPPDSQPEQIEFHDSMFSDGTAAALN
ncbi:DUF4352 domain-containing protein [Skermania piniformis]|uniref:DUF4352 domain-containing protein n=2 Tax=Skermania pinensis TaxID=39122 RepID=A0ABX8SEM8_9ACTN|nr:DUF4352 domain-containing protein [Skermania piniformis]